MQPDDILRALRELRDRIEVQCGSVGRKNGALLHDLIELFKDFLLDLHAFECRFDDQIHIFQQGIVQRRCDECHALIECRLGHGALLQCAPVIAPHRGEPLVERLLLHFQQHHRNSGIDEAHADAAAHRARADDADLANRPRRCVIRHVEDMRRRTLGLEHVTQRRGFRRQHERGK